MKVLLRVYVFVVMVFVMCIVFGVFVMCGMCLGVMFDLRMMVMLMVGVMVCVFVVYGV